MNIPRTQKFAVISHTHWDREWYTPFENFRLRLVDLMDRLLKIIEKDNSYIFHLDAQTVVLEDYLEIKPENEEILKKYIKSGNIIIGPWYLQNDFYYTDGESTIRNLIRGHKIAEKFGACSKVGYAPDQFGNISQLPQILNDFGIDSFIFGRGYRKIVKDENGNIREDVRPTEFIWRGADGSELLGIFMKGWYNNAQHIPVDKETALELLRDNYLNFKDQHTADNILLMNGVDHLEAQPDVNDAIDLLKGLGFDIRQYSLDEYVQYLKDYHAKNNSELFVFEGALNKGHDGELLKGCRSSRTYLKRENIISEDLLENKIEPLYAYLEANGFKGVYPHGQLDYLWKMLLRNHPHDSICGCSRDAVHAHMEDSYARLQECGNDVLARGMKLLNAHTKNVNKDDKNYQITLFNPTEKAYEGAVECDLKLLVNEDIKDFAIYDENGNAVAYEIVSQNKENLDVVSPLNLPGVLEINRVIVRFVTEVEPFGVRSFAVVPHDKGVIAKNEYSTIENKKYIVKVNGTELEILDKENGETYKNPFYIQDECDKGDSYLFIPISEQPLVIEPTAISITENAAYKKTITLNYDYDCPIDYDATTGARTKETNAMSVKVELSLNADDSAIELKTWVNNTCKQHRVRLGVRAGIAGDTIVTDSPFDWGEKALNDCGEVTGDPTTCNSTFVTLSKENKGVSLYTEGLHEAQKLGNDIMLTLVRATGAISRFGDYSIAGGENFTARENNCLRTIYARIGVEFGKKTPTQCFISAKQFRVGVLALGDSFDHKKYSGGRFAVQAGYSVFYYLPDEFPELAVTGKGKISFEGDDIILSAYKCDEKGNIILRFVNFAEEDRTLTVNYDGKITITDMAEKREKGEYENEFSALLSAKQIITLKLYK